VLEEKNKMKSNRSTFYMMAIVTAIIFVINLHCWKPGIGDRTDNDEGKQVSGTEISLYFGWPAYYVAELWRSDESLQSELLKRAPFFLVPDSMWMADRYVSIFAMVIDITFLLSAVLLIGIVWNSVIRDLWTVKRIGFALGLVIILLICYLQADAFSAFL
jgi:hypothetical protein